MLETSETISNVRFIIIKIVFTGADSLLHSIEGVGADAVPQ